MKKGIWLIIVIIVVIIFVIGFLFTSTSCQEPVSREGMFDFSKEETASLVEAPSAAMPRILEKSLGSSEITQDAKAKETAETNQKIIKTGNLDLVVKKVSQAVSKITTITTEKKGFIASSDVYTRDDGTQYGRVVALAEKVDGITKIVDKVNN